jgi:hypothetical protein
MTDPQHDHEARTGARYVDEDDFAEEHSGPTHADELTDRPGMEPDEAVPTGLDGG